MSDNIRDKIYEYSRGHLLSEYAIFTIFQYSFYMQICAIMRNNFFAPGDRLF